MNNPEDKEFDAYLKGGSSLSQTYAQLKDPKVPLELDAAIQESARIDRSSPFSFTHKIKTSSIDSPLAMAAVVMLCVSLVLVFSINETEQDFEKIQGTPESPLSSRSVLIQGKGTISEDDSLVPLAKELKYGEVVLPSKSNEPFNQRAAKKNSQQAQLDEALSPDAKSKIREDEGLSLEEVSGSSLVKPVTENLTKLKLRQHEVMAIQLKELINNGHVMQAIIVYKKFCEDFPNTDLSNWLTDQEISLLEAD